MSDNKQAMMTLDDSVELAEYKLRESKPLWKADAKNFLYQEVHLLPSTTRYERSIFKAKKTAEELTVELFLARDKLSERVNSVKKYTLQLEERLEAVRKVADERELPYNQMLKDVSAALEMPELEAVYGMNRSMIEPDELSGILVQLYTLKKLSQIKSKRFEFDNKRLRTRVLHTCQKYASSILPEGVRDSILKRTAAKKLEYESAGDLESLNW